MSSNQKLSSRLHNSFSVSFLDYPNFTPNPNEITLEQKRDNHDILTLSFSNFTPVMLKGLKTQSPVQVSWRTSNGIKGTFFGVVYGIKRTHTIQTHKEVEIMCLGLTFLMKESRSGVWSNKTIDYVVNLIAKRNGLKAVVSGHPARYSQITQQGETDWEFLIRLAEMSGYTISIKEKTILFKSIDEVISDSLDEMPILYQEQSFIPAFSSSEEQTLDRISPLEGDYLESPDFPHNSFKITRGVDPIKAQTFTSNESPKNKKQTRVKKSDPIFTEELTSSVSNTKEFSQSVAKAKAAKSRFNMPANFQSQGDPRISPNSLVEVQGVEMGDADGYWLVHQVTHQISSNGSYKCKGILLSDGKEENKGSSKSPNRQSDTPKVNLRAKLKNQTATKKRPKYKKPITTFVKGKAKTSTGKWG